MAIYNSKETRKPLKMKNDTKGSLASVAPPTDDESGISVDPNGDGTFTVTFDDSTQDTDISSEYGDEETKGHYANLVNEIDEDALQRLGIKVLEAVQEDDGARSDWQRMIDMGMDLLGVKLEEKNEPFDGACSAQHPLLMESAVKFQSKASNELLPADGPVKVKIIGDSTLEKEEVANRVKAHMNYQITEEMTEYYVDTEKLLLYTAFIGSGFKKTYYCSHFKRPVSEFIPADQFIVPNSASDLYRAPRYTHVLYKTEYEFEEDCANGLYIKPEAGLAPPSEAKLSDTQRRTQELVGMTVSLGDKSKVYTFYEQHLDCCIEGLDEYKGKEDYKLASPYIVTIDANTGCVIGVRRNWSEDDEQRKKKVPFTHWGFVPGFGFYNFGFLHLLGNIQLSLTSSLRSLVDAGQFATLQGGFKLKGVRIIDDGSPIYPGQFKDLEAATNDISKAIMPLPFKEPSQTLFAMLQFLDEKGGKFADATEQIIGDSSNYGPVGTTLALLDASTKFFSAIHKRLHKAQKQELRIIANINAETLGDDIEYNQNQSDKLKVTKEDYNALIDIVPVSDPNISSNAHRMAKAQTVYQIAMQSPDLHDMREVLKHVYINMDLGSIDKILPTPEEAQPNDPMTDIQFAVQGKPIKAFPGQDHKAHIAIKQSFMQDPYSGANPLMQKASASVQANIQEHMMLSFTEQVQAQSQLSGGQAQEGTDPTVQAAQQVAQMNQAKLQQEQQGQQGDTQGQAALLLAKSSVVDSQTKAKQVDFDNRHKVANLMLDKDKLDFQKQQEAAKMAVAGKKMDHEIQKIVTTKGLDRSNSWTIRTNCKRPAQRGQG